MSEIWVSFPDLQDCIGKEKAEELCKRFGGLAPYLPARPRKTHALAAVIGIPALRQLAANFGGYHVALPNLRRPVSAKAKVWELLEQGWKHAAIAEECGVTERWVRTLAARKRSTE